MTNLPTSILHIFAIFSPVFSSTIYQNIFKLFLGHILCKGRRTVADILRTLGLENIKNFSKFHWVFSGAKWECLKASKILFLFLVNFFCSKDEEIFITIDSTLERRRGPKIQGLGCHRDAVRSTKKRKVITTGLSWLVCGLKVTLPFSKSAWTLPFLSVLLKPEHVLSTSKNFKDLNKPTKHKKLTLWTYQIMCCLRRWTFREITVVADSAFSCIKLAYAFVEMRVALITRIRLDARLNEFINPNQKTKRKRVAGKLLPKLSVLAKKKMCEWQKVTVKYYGGETKELFIQSGKCLWYYVGFTPVPIHWVLIKENENSEPVALFSTNLMHTVKVIIEAYIGRWGIEVVFEECRRHLGLGTQRQWADKSIERITPAILASFSLITAMAFDMSKQRKEEIPLQSTSWYKKEHITFSDLLAYLRKPLWQEKYTTLVGKKGEFRKRDVDEFIKRAAAA